ncbi:OadG family protein [Methylobacter psychrophilus]|jgi:oxaloacetate decarboxylase gamma subunit|uniref:OadG family protein n=1 Tax=Methylobacter psychrophilus TaxID=96941 RepID=UPI0021D4CFE4|nr:OadG family transporter subunit [Methylobacter psychrophilus]
MTEMMSSGVELMLAGMSIVFLFLTMLVIAINLMSSLVQRFFPDAPVLVAVPKVSSGIDKSIIAAITAAVHQHRSKHKKS